MAEEMSREELVDLVKEIITVRENGTNRVFTEEEHHALVLKFKKNINHPGGSDLIYYPELVGLPPKPTVDAIVDLAIKGIDKEEGL